MEDKIKQIKLNVLDISFKAQACHISSALSCVETLVKLFYSTPPVKPEDFLFGKASGVATYYAILSDLGYFSTEKAVDFLRKYPLPSKEVPGLVHSFGSVGHALSVAAGMAYANRNRNITVLLSDGDCQEGSTLEACLFIHHHHLTNLHVLVDNNKYIACGLTDDILKMQPVWEFMQRCIPNCDIVDTVKGAGVSFMENNYEWHYKNLTKELYDQACQELR